MSDLFRVGLALLISLALAVSQSPSDKVALQIEGWEILPKPVELIQDRTYLVNYCGVPRILYRGEDKWVSIWGERNSAGVRLISQDVTVLAEVRDTKRFTGPP